MCGRSLAVRPGRERRRSEGRGLVHKGHQIEDRSRIGPPDWILRLTPRVVWRREICLLLALTDMPRGRRVRSASDPKRRFNSEPAEMRPNIPGAGAGPGAGDGGGVRPAVIVPLDRKAAGGFWDALDGGGGGPASSPGTPPGMAARASLAVLLRASPSCDPASSVATAPEGSWVGLKASMIALGRPGSRQAVFRFTLSILIPGGGGTELAAGRQERS